MKRMKSDEYNKFKRIMKRSGKWVRTSFSLNRRWQRNHLISKYGNICFLCNKTFKSIKDITFDHHIPFSKGGKDDISNFRLAHFECNQTKNDMTYEEYLIFQNGKDNNKTL